MKEKITLRFSLVGLALMITSAITAAIFSANRKHSITYDNPGTLVVSNILGNNTVLRIPSDPLYKMTCKTVLAGHVPNCNNTPTGAGVSGSTGNPDNVNTSNFTTAEGD